MQRRGKDWPGERQAQLPSAPDGPIRAADDVIRAGEAEIGIRMTTLSLAIGIEPRKGPDLEARSERVPFAYEPYPRHPQHWYTMVPSGSRCSPGAAPVLAKIAPRNCAASQNCSRFRGFLEGAQSDHPTPQTICIKRELVSELRLTSGWGDGFLESTSLTVRRE
jgi:hypothetical protein